MNIEKIRQELEKIKDNESKLYSYLYDLTYQEVTSNVRFLETIYSKFLNDKRSEIRRVAIYCLLFGLQIKKPEYKNKALLNMKDKSNDLDLRRTCISGLAQAYFATDDQEILNTFYSTYNNHDEDEDLRAESFVGMLKVHGLNSAEILNKNNNKLIMYVDDIEFAHYEREIEDIKDILNRK
jgi:hypothetical protein